MLRSTTISHLSATLTIVFVAAAGTLFWLYKTQTYAVLPVPKPAEPTRALVLASSTKQDISWTQQIEGWQIIQYMFDDIHADHSVPRNQGREAMVYLSYIIDHYHDLPDYVAFVHGHETGWHQAVSMPLLLRAMNYTMIDERGYVNLRCQTKQGCPDNDDIDTNYEGDNRFRRVGVLFRGFHQYAFRATDPWYRPMPDRLKSVVGAQFVVTREAITRQPRRYWERLRLPLTRDLKELKVWFDGVTPGSWLMGMMFEKSWAYLFGQKSQECPDETLCWNSFYQGKLMCDDRDGRQIDKVFFPANCTYVE